MTPALRRFVLRIAAFFNSGRADAELAREIRSHLQLLEDKFIAQGMSSEDARFAARRAFGGVDQTKEQQRDTRAFRWLDNSWIDLKLGARMLVKYPGLTLVGGLGMAVAIAIGATSFAFFYASLHPTLPLPEGDRIVGLENYDGANNNQEHRIIHDFVAWREEVKSVEGLSAFEPATRNLITADGQSKAVTLALMSASGFKVARVAPLLGRTLLDSDERAGARDVVVISYDVWQARFGADPQIIGRDVRVGSTLHTIIGVMPEGFAFPVNYKVWVPLRANPADYARRRGPRIYVFGRLRPGATLETAQAELSTIGLRASAEFPKTHEQLRPRVVRFTELWFDDGRLANLHVMQTLITMLLLVICVNVACLVYARTATRQGEIAVRTALGASRGRIIGQLFVEALVLAVLASVAGLGLAKFVLAQALAAVQQFNESVSGLPFWMTFELSSGTILYVAGVSIMAALVVGVLPGMKATGRNVQARLRQSTATGASMKLGATWTSLIVAQIALAMMVLPGAVFMAWRTMRLASSHGFDAEHFLKATVAMDQERPPTAQAEAYSREYDVRYNNRLNDLLRRLEAEPGIAGVTVASIHPGGESSTTVEIENDSQAPRSGAGRAKFAQVDLNFFDLYGVPLLAGRRFLAADQQGSAGAVIVNRTFVEHFFGEGNALSRRVGHTSEGIHPKNAIEKVRRLTGAAEGDFLIYRRDGKEVCWHEVVGVVGNLPANPVVPDDVMARMYLPLRPGEIYPANLSIRARGGDIAALTVRVREIGAALDPAVRLNNIQTLTEVYRLERLGWRWGALGFAIATASVVLLSAAGIYALTSFTVTRRRREIGIRVALGANQRRILANIFSRAVMQLALGVVIGSILAVWLESVTGEELMEGNESVLLPIAAIAMMAVGALAALGPARRCLRVHPMDALREE